MDDLESRLRDEVTRRTQGFSPSGDLPERIESRVRHRRRQRQVLAGLALSGAAAVLALGMVLVDSSGDEGGSVRMRDDNGVVDDDDGEVRTIDDTTMTRPDRSTTTSSTEPEDGTPTSSSSSIPSSTTSLVLEEPSFNQFTPLTRRGMGPIEVGMTVAEAEAAAEVSIVVHAPLTPDATCTQAQVAGMDVWLELELPGTPGTDPRAVGVIRSVLGHVTQEGIAVGSSPAALARVYGQPTRTFDSFTGTVQIYESGGYAYAATVSSTEVLYLMSGDPDWVETPEGCQEIDGGPGGTGIG